MMNNVMGGFARLEMKMDTLGGREYVALGSRGLFVLLLLPYYFNSALTKIDGFGLSAGAFAQILPPIAEQYLYDTSAIPFFPWHLIVWAGTIGEFVFADPDCCWLVYPSGGPWHDRLCCCANRG